MEKDGRTEEDDRGAVKQSAPEEIRHLPACVIFMDGGVK